MEEKESVKILTLKDRESSDAKLERMASLTAPKFSGITQNIVLEAVFQDSYNDQNATAVINGKALKVNDYIYGYRLEAINETSVVLRSSTERLKLSLFTSIIIK